MYGLLEMPLSSNSIAPGKIALAEQQGLLMPISQEDALQKK